MKIRDREEGLLRTFLTIRILSTKKGQNWPRLSFIFWMIYDLIFYLVSQLVKESFVFLVILKLSVISDKA